MLRRLLIWILLAPLPLNGLWMLCKDAVPAQTSSAETDMAEEDGADCSKICERKPQTGSICLISPGDKSSITILVYGVAIPSALVRFIPAAVSGQVAPQYANSYRSPTIIDPSPPPRA